jgi:hypothetical protein
MTDAAVEWRVPTSMVVADWAGTSLGWPVSFAAARMRHLHFARL